MRYVTLPIEELEKLELKAKCIDENYVFVHKAFFNGREYGSSIYGLPKEEVNIIDKLKEEIDKLIVERNDLRNNYELLKNNNNQVKKHWFFKW